MGVVGDGVGCLFFFYNPTTTPPRTSWRRMPCPTRSSRQEALAMPDGRLLVRGGTVVGPDGRRRADVLIVGGRIAAVGEGLEVAGGHVLDGAGLHVLPGGIDGHSHPWEAGVA